MRVHTSFTTSSTALLALYAQHVLATDPNCPIIGPTPPTTCDGSDGVWFPVSVAGRGTYCTLGPEICVAQNFAACPGPAIDLPFGAMCKQLEAKVYGCVPKTSCSDGELDDVMMTPRSSPTSTKLACEGGCEIDPSTPGTCDELNGWYPVSVVGAGVFCVQGPICAADSQAACPGPQHGLPFGSSCTRIPSGVFGCIENDKCQNRCDSAQKGNDMACDTASDTSTKPQNSSVTTVLPTHSPTRTPSGAPTTSTTLTSSSPPTTPTQSASSPGISSTPSTSTPAKSSTPGVSIASTNPPDASDNLVPDDVVIDDNMSLLPVPDLVDTFTIGNIETISAAQSPESVSIPTLNAAHQLLRQ